MLRDELLRTKNEEIARCLLSRKRKLSELYYATVGLPCTNDGSHYDDAYRQNEAAFLNANDITKGHRYDERTVSVRPDGSLLANPFAYREQEHFESRAQLRNDDQTKPSDRSQTKTGPTQFNNNASTPEKIQKPLAVPSPGPKGIGSPSYNGTNDEPSNAAGPAGSGPSGEAQWDRVSGDKKAVSIVVPPKQIEGASSPMSTGQSSNHTYTTERSPASSSTELFSAMNSAAPQNQSKGYTHLSPAPLGPSDRTNATISTPDDQLKLEATMSIKAPVRGDEYRLKGSDGEALNSFKYGVNGVLSRSQELLSASSGVSTPAVDGKKDDQRKIANSTSESVTVQPSLAIDQSQQLLKSQDTSTRSSNDGRQLAERVPHELQILPTTSSRLRLHDLNQKPKKFSTVVFSGSKAADKATSKQLIRSEKGSLSKSPNEDKDYLYTLFQAKAHYPPRTVSLNTLLSTAHKTLTTANHFLEYQEQMDCRTLKRIYQLQHSNCWALRQLQRSPEPSRQATHWDLLMDHVRWMRMDFREERKWKIAAAKRCAEWCAEYVTSDEERRASLRIPIRAQPSHTEVSCDNAGPTDAQTLMTVDGAISNDHPTPDLVASAEDDSVSDEFNDEPQLDFDNRTMPADIFASGFDEFTFRLENTPASEKLFGELPYYYPASLIPETNLPSLKNKPDEIWKTDLAPVSKYALGKIKFEEEGPPRKRSRYDYDLSDEDDDAQSFRGVLPPEQDDVALFLPEYRNLRDRIHPSRSFRPPTEFLMPPVGFYESRQSSQWTYAEDDELRRLVEDYSFNWSLISSYLSSRSKYTSGAERRTPWECFERWIGLEGLPAEMAKTPYFRAYSARLEAAQRSILNAQQQAIQQQQQQGNQPVPQALIRRRTAQPIRVERKRSSRHLALLAGMRKLSQKREAIFQKQQHAPQVASLRKANEASSHPRPPISTPQEFSRLKHEREVKYQEKQEQYRLQMIAHQRAALAQRTAQQQQIQQQLQQNGQQASFNGVPGRNPQAVANGVVSASSQIPNRPQNNANRSQPRPAQNGQGIPNGLPGNGTIPPGGMPMKVVNQPGLQQPISGRPGLPLQASVDSARIMREANRVQEQQRLAQSRQQQQQHQFHGQPQHFASQISHSPKMNMPASTAQNNASLLAAFQAAGGTNGSSYPGTALNQNVSNASPRMNHVNTANHMANAQMVPSIASLQNSIQRSHPTMNQEQVNKLAADRLQQYQQQQQQQQQRLSQAALNAAAGNAGAIPHNFQVGRDGNVSQVTQQNVTNGGAVMQNQQTQGYSTLLRASQANQARNLNVGSPAMNGIVMQQNRSATPQAHLPANST